MNEKEFLDAAKGNIAYIEKCISKINELVKRNEPIRFFNDRLELLILACRKVVDCQKLYLDFSQNSQSSSTQYIVRFDYKTSEYANRLYVNTDNMLNYYFTNKKNKNLDHISPKDVLDISDLSRKMMYIAARWFTERQMNVWDSDKEVNKQKLPRRLPLLHDVMPCFDRVLATKMGIKFDDGFMPRKLIVCVPPSSGKTYEANVYTNLMLAHHQIRYKETGLIRMTNTADNAYTYGSQVHKMMIDDKYTKIFPEFTKYRTSRQSGSKLKPFLYESREKYLLQDCLPECSDSMFLFGVEASINGKRSLLGAILDDLSGGQGDMDNDELHKKITDKVMSDVLDRSDDDESPIVIMGTMYNENDVQNAFINLWTQKGLIQHPTLKNVRYTPDGRNAICLVDIEDEYGKSIAPELYTNEKLEEKKAYFIARGKPYVYNLIYRQKKDSRNPKEFADDTLMHYKWGELPDDLEQTSLSMMDLTRRNGNDYFAGPFLRYCPSDGLYYLVDTVFEQKSLGLVDDPKNEFRDQICDKIIKNKTVEVCIENNVSNTTGSLLKQRCYELNYKICKFRERYTARTGKSSTKASRILNMSETIKNYIVFPDKNTIPVGNKLYLAMEQLNNWDSKSNSRDNHDDFPDALAQFVAEFIFKGSRLGEIGGFNLDFANDFRKF